MTRNRRLWSWLIVLGVAALVVGCAFWLDPVVASWLLQHRNRTAQMVMRQVSRFGDWPEHVALGLVLLGAAWWRGNKKWARIFIAMLVACALAGATARVIKIATGRARPSVKTEQAWTGPRLSEKFHAFPSGHTAASTAFFAVLFFVNWRIGLCCLPIPFLIAFSRMYVAAHYLSDVVCAALVGVICAAAVEHFLNIGVPRSAIHN